jgi:cyclase
MAANKPVAILYLIAAFVLSFGASGPAKENPELTKLSDDIYVHLVNPDSDAVSNSGVVVLDQTVLVFDTHFTPEAGHRLLADIKSITPKPIRYVINSHAHADHTHGNQVFTGAQIISSSNARRDIMQVDLPSMNRTLGVTQAQLEKLRRDLAQQTDAAEARRLREQIKSREDYLTTMSRLKITAPVVTFDDTLSIQDVRRQTQLLSLGGGHTDGDIVLYVPSAKIAFLGDLFFNRAIPNVQDADILQWMKTLEQVLKLDADVFVPGHGPVGSRKEVERFLSYLQELKSLVEPYVSRGDTADQAIRDIEMPKKFAEYSFQNFFPLNIQKMYAEVKASQIATIPSEGPKKREREKPR